MARRIRSAGAGHQLSLTQLAVISRLGTNGPATISDLARAESMKPQSMGAAVADLEEMGLVERQPHPSDGRQIHIVLSERGAALRDETRAAKRNWLSHAVAELTEDEQKLLFKASELLKRLGEM